jgi:hypothetical protein
MLVLFDLKPMDCVNCSSFRSFAADYCDDMEPSDLGFCLNEESPYFFNEGAGSDVVCKYWEGIEFELTHLARKPDVRRYYVHWSKHFLLVLRNGLDLPDVQGQIVDANIGWDHGEAGYVREVGRRHSKLTVYRLAEGDPESSLSSLLIEAPVGERGRRELKMSQIETRLMVIARELEKMALTAKGEGRDSSEVWLKQQATKFLEKRLELSDSRRKVE